MVTSFTNATTELFTKLTAEDLADELGCSVQSVKQARMTKEDSSANRPPPKGWEKAVIKLAERQAAHFARLAAKLKALPPQG